MSAEKPMRQEQKAGSELPLRPLMGLAFWALVVYLAFRFYSAFEFIVLVGLAAAAVASLVEPLADRLPGPRPLQAAGAVLVLVLALAGILAVVGLLLYQPIEANIHRFPAIREGLNSSLSSLSASLGLDTDLTVEHLAEIVVRTLTGGSAEDMLSNALGGTLSAVLGIVVVLVGAAYMLARPVGRVLRKGAQLLPPGRRRPTLDALHALKPELRWWLLGTMFSMLVIGTVTGLGFWAVGLEFALPLAILAAAMQIIPNYGAMVTSAVALLIAAPQGLAQTLGVLGVYLAVQGIESYLLTPLVMKKAVHIPPIVTLFTIVFWGNIFGVAGLLLAIPLDLTVWLLLEHHIVRFYGTATAGGAAD